LEEPVQNLLAGSIFIGVAHDAPARGKAWGGEPGWVTMAVSTNAPGTDERTVIWKVDPTAQPPEHVTVTHELPPQVVGAPQLRPPVVLPQAVMVAPLGAVTTSCTVPVFGRADVSVRVHTVELPVVGLVGAQFLVGAVGDEPKVA
jgi:hypothetical protein